MFWPAGLRVTMHCRGGTVVGGFAQKLLECVKKSAKQNNRNCTVVSFVPVDAEQKAQ